MLYNPAILDKVEDILANNKLEYLLDSDYRILKYVKAEDIEDFKRSVPPSILKSGDIKTQAELYYKHKKEDTK